ncbi:hypothetical protein C8R44DRAFT_728543 [Mycena epipterygia]|nr:hypothetical protein C8R44DRAFT_728543 [Mycena epipterygia]
MSVPHLRWTCMTHQERASARLDMHTDWRWKCALILNSQTKVYAGQYKGVVLLSVVLVLTSESSVPWIAGQPKLMGGTSYAEMVWLVVLLFNCCWIPEDEYGENGK